MPLYFQGETPNTDESYSGEFFGAGSRCILGNIIDSSYRLKSEDGALCYNIQCERNGRQLRIKIKGSDDLVCTTQGARVSANKTFKGGVVCPDPRTFCNS
jgi:hypothetical protein